MILNSQPIFNPVNNAFIYLCPDEDGKYWIRSTAGNWVKIESDPLTFDIILEDFKNFQQSEKSVSENDVKVDNASQLIIEPNTIK